MPERDLRIDPEFRDLLPKLSAEELGHLESSIEDEGCREYIVVWANHNDTIIDGHNRYDICKRLGVPFKTRAITLGDREAVKEWMYRNQLGRRNVTDEQRKYVVGKLYEARKKRHGGTGANQHTKEQKDQNDPSADTASQIASELGVGEATVKRAALFAKGVDVIAQALGDSVKEALLSGTTKATEAEVQKIGRKGAATKAEAKSVVNGDGRKREPADSASSGAIARLADITQRLTALVDRPSLQVSHADVRLCVKELSEIVACIKEKKRVRTSRR